jgi:hypothetical protein
MVTWNFWLPATMSCFAGDFRSRKSRRIRSSLRKLASGDRARPQFALPRPPAAGGRQLTPKSVVIAIRIVTTSVATTITTLSTGAAIAETSAATDGQPVPARLDWKQAGRARQRACPPRASAGQSKWSTACAQIGPTCQTSRGYSQGGAQIWRTVRRGLRP